MVSEDPAVHERVVREALRAAAELELDASPPTIAQRMQHRIRQLSGADDPYEPLKRRANSVMMAALPDLSAEVRAAEDPLSAAIRLAIAANTIDVGASGAESIRSVERQLQAARAWAFAGDVEELRAAVASARTILFLTDNSGEVVVDRLLAEQLPLERVTFAVRGAPVLNDATMADARVTGLDRLAEVIDNGSDAPGTVLSDCSAEFRRRFRAADLVIAKGQGNYESLSDEPCDIFFLFAVKCEVAAQHSGLPRGTRALLRSRAGRRLAAEQGVSSAIQERGPGS